MPRHIVFAAGGVVVFAAALGGYLGVSRSLSAPSPTGEDAGVIVPAVTPVASAKPILTPTAAMDEQEVRRLAREEAQAILAKSAPRKAAPASNDDDTDAAAPEQLTPIAPSGPLAVPKPAPGPPPG